MTNRSNANGVHRRSPEEGDDHSGQPSGAGAARTGPAVTLAVDLASGASRTAIVAFQRTGSGVGRAFDVGELQAAVDAHMRSIIDDAVRTFSPPAIAVKAAESILFSKPEDPGIWDSNPWDGVTEIYSRPITITDAVLEEGDEPEEPKPIVTLADMKRAMAAVPLPAPKPATTATQIIMRSRQSGISHVQQMQLRQQQLNAVYRSMLNTVIISSKLFYVSSPDELDPPKPVIENAGVRVGEIIAWRAWWLSGGFLPLHLAWVLETEPVGPPAPKRWTLRSLTAGTDWPADAPVVSDGVTDRDDDPEERPRSGVHAFRDAGGLLRYIAGQGQLRHVPPLILGQVALWGDYVEHDLGYRAEFAQVHSVAKVIGHGLPSFEEQRILKQISATYGVPIVAMPNHGGGE